MTPKLSDMCREMMAFDYANSRIAYQHHKWPMNETMSQHTFWTEGQAQENARTAALTEALCKAVDALEQVLFMRERGNDLEYPESLALADATDVSVKQALADIRKCLGEK